MNKSKTSSTTWTGLASGLSILFIHTITGRFSSKAFFNTNFVCGIGPSKASTTKTTPLTIFRTLSTSPPKSAWPGVSMILIFLPLCITAVFFESIVIPRSFSRSPESITLSWTTWFSLNVPDCLSIWSTKVVLPWSTCAMIAIFLKSSLNILFLLNTTFYYNTFL